MALSAARGRPRRGGGPTRATPTGRVGGSCLRNGRPASRPVLASATTAPPVTAALDHGWTRRSDTAIRRTRGNPACRRQIDTSASFITNPDLQSNRNSSTRRQSSSDPNRLLASPGCRRMKAVGRDREGIGTGGASLGLMLGLTKVASNCSRSAVASSQRQIDCRGPLRGVIRLGSTQRSRVQIAPPQPVAPDNQSVPPNTTLLVWYLCSVCRRVGTHPPNGIPTTFISRCYG
jgi:hypothetical protein